MVFQPVFVRIKKFSIISRRCFRVREKYKGLSIRMAIIFFLVNSVMPQKPPVILFGKNSADVKLEGLHINTEWI